jgi:hypothetical protein
MNTVIDKSLASELGGGVTDAHIRALVPFSARLQQDVAVLFRPPSFPEVDVNTPVGLRWVATSVVTRNSQGIFKLYMCNKNELAVWIPCGDSFVSNQSIAKKQSIAEFARNSTKFARSNRDHKRKGDLYDRKEGPVRPSQSNWKPADNQSDKDQIDLIRLRAEERREIRLKQEKVKNQKNDLKPTLPSIMSLPKIDRSKTTDTSSTEVGQPQPSVCCLQDASSKDASAGNKITKSENVKTHSIALAKRIEKKKAKWQLIRLAKKEKAREAAHKTTNNVVDDNKSSENVPAGPAIGCSSSSSSLTNEDGSSPSTAAAAPPPTTTSSPTLNDLALRVLGPISFPATGSTPNKSSISFGSFVPVDINDINFEDILLGDR